MSKWFQSQTADFYNTGYIIWSHDMKNVSIPEVNILKNRSTFAVTAPIILSIKLHFVSFCKRLITHFHYLGTFMSISILSFPKFYVMTFHYFHDP